MTNGNINTPRNETFTWLEPGAWRKPCIVHVTMVANSRQALFGKLTHDGFEAVIEKTLQRKAEAKHYTYRPIPVESQRYRFVAMNEIGRLLVDR